MAKRTIMSDLKGKSKPKGKAGTEDESDDDIDLTEDESDDEDDDSEEDESDDEDSDDDDEDDAELSPKIKAILKKNRDRVREVEKENRRLKKGVTSSRKKDDDDSDEDDDAPSQRTVALELKLKKSAAKAALLEAGLTGEAGRFVRMLDFDDVDIDDDGDVDGLEDQIDELKDDYPEFFVDSKKPIRRRAPGSRDTGSGRGKADDKPKSSTARLAAQLVGKG